MRNKKIIFLILIFTITGIILSLNYIFSSSSTTAIIAVLDKGYSVDNEEAWIKVVPPNIHNIPQYEYKISVKDPMVWNLIEKGQTYLVNYKKRDNLRTLNYIKNIDDDQAIPDHIDL